MKTKISKRDIKFFLLGLFTFFVIDSVINWDESTDAFKRGYENGKIEVGK